MSDEHLDPGEARVRSYMRRRGDVPVPGDLLAAARRQAGPASQHRFGGRLSFGFASISAAATTVVVLVVAVLVGAWLIPRGVPQVAGPVSSPAPAATAGPFQPTPPPTQAVSVPATAGPASNPAPTLGPAKPTAAPATFPAESPAPETSSPSPSPSPLPNPAVVPFPAEALGLPVQNVASALDLIAHGGANGREIAVAGYWNMPGYPYSCMPYPDYGTGAAPDCLLMYLADSDLHLGTYSDPADPNSLKSWGPPTGPALQPVINQEVTGVVDAIFPGAPYDLPLGTAARRVVIAGHTGDPRAWACVFTPTSQCMGNFILDRVAWVEGRDAPSGVTPSVYIAPGDQPVLSSQAAVDTVQSEFPSGTLLTVFPTQAALAHTIDPRIRAGTTGLVWIARAISGPADASGTAPLDEVVIDDSTGQVLQRLSAASSADYQPATVVLSGGRGNGGTFDVELPDGTVILTGDTAVLEAGDYRILAWTGNAPPSNPPAGACTKDIHLHALEHASFVASFGGPTYDTGPCTWDRVPAPTPY
jgi:hypothetical protein